MNLSLNALNKLGSTTIGTDMVLNDNFQIKNAAELSLDADTDNDGNVNVDELKTKVATLKATYDAALREAEEQERRFGKLDPATRSRVQHAQADFERSNHFLSFFGFYASQVGGNVVPGGLNLSFA